MDDAEVVRGVDGVRGLPQPADRELARDAAALEPAREGAAAQVFHGHVRTALPLADVVDPHDLEHVREPGDGHRLAPQPGTVLLVVGELLGEDLDRDLAAELAVECGVDVGRPSAVETFGTDVPRREQ